MNVRAIGLDVFGGPDVLHEVELPQRDPGPGQVRIAVSAAGVNPTDATLRAGGRTAQLAGLPAPYVPGMELAGTIDALGAGVDARLRLGDRVIALVLPFTETRGAYTTSILVDQRSVVHAPPGASDPEAATLLLNAVTATLALDALRLAPGETVAITGAPGAVGRFAIALAKQRGLIVAADSRPGREGDASARGADVVLPRGAGFVRELREHLPDGAAGLIDAAALNDEALPAIADNGAIASLKGWSGPAVRGLRVEAISSFGAVTDTPLLERVRDLASDGTLPLEIADVIPAQDAPDAHRRLAAGGLDGRLVLDLTTLERSS